MFWVRRVCCLLRSHQKSPPEVTALGSFIHRLPTAAKCQSTPLTSGCDPSTNKLTCEGVACCYQTSLSFGIQPLEFLRAGWHITVGTFHLTTLQYTKPHPSTKIGWKIVISTNLRLLLTDGHLLGQEARSTWVPSTHLGCLQAATTT
jgi:hypothetical protein